MPNAPRHLPLQPPNTPAGYTHTRAIVCFSPAPLSSSLPLQVYIPLAGNPKNSARWPKVLAHDIQDSFAKFLSTSSFLLSQTRGNTVLPMPTPQTIAGLASAASPWDEYPRQADPELERRKVCVALCVESNVLFCCHSRYSPVGGRWGKSALGRVLGWA